MSLEIPGGILLRKQVTHPVSLRCSSCALKICFQGTGSSEPVAREGYFWRQLSQLPAKANLLQTIPKANGRRVQQCPAMSSLCKSGKRTSARRQIPKAMQNFAKPFLKRRATGKADCNLITSLSMHPILCDMLQYFKHASCGGE